jgi:hypothetical protein
MIPCHDARCGICGDAWDAAPREHEAPGGKFANGILVRSYRPGAEVAVTVLVSANHKGYFTFRLCRNNDVAKDPEQAGRDGAAPLPAGLLRGPGWPSAGGALW